MHPKPSTLGVNVEFLVSSPRPALCAVRDKSDYHSPPPSAPSSTATSVLETAAPEAPTEYGHTITLKILNGSKVLRAIVFLRQPWTRRLRSSDLRSSASNKLQAVLDPSTLKMRLFQRNWIFLSSVVDILVPQHSTGGQSQLITKVIIK